jgi:hypothetical protein
LADDGYWKAQALEKIEELQEEKDNDEIKNIQRYVDTIKEILLFKGTLITHYTDLPGTKALLLDEGSSFRMSEANYMNDTTEGERLRETVIKKENLNGVAKMPFIEKPFLGSFVDIQKCDDLTLWRMYAKTDGVDGKGFAITLHRDKLFDIMMKTFTNKEESDTKEILDERNKNKDIKSTSSSDEFQFYKVAYLNEKGKCVGEDKTVLNEAISSLKKSFKTLKNDFKKAKTEKKGTKEKESLALITKGLERLSEIEYLFKGIEYQHESEVRLILSKTGKVKHIKVDTSDYFEVPKVYLNIGNILQAVDSITIGPKVERPKEWASAFNYNFLEKKMKESKVYISRLPYK